MNWTEKLNYDPIPALLHSGYEHIFYFTQKDLLDKIPGSVKILWGLPEAQSFLRKQKAGGYWKYPGKDENHRFPEDYPQLETYRRLGFLVEKYGFNRKSPAVDRAARFLFGCLAPEGDFGGIYGNHT